MSWTGQSWGLEQPRFVADLAASGSADIIGFGLDGVWVSLNTGARRLSSAQHGPLRVQPPHRLDGRKTSPARCRSHRRRAGGHRRLRRRGRLDRREQRRRHLPEHEVRASQTWVTIKAGASISILASSSISPAKAAPTSSASATPASGPPSATATEPFRRRNSSSPTSDTIRAGASISTRASPLDVTGDGKADLVGFGDAGVWVAVGNGDGTFQTPTLVLDGFDAAQGWVVDQGPEDSRRPRRLCAAPTSSASATPASGRR